MLGLALAAASGQAEVYKYVKNGVVHYTNRRLENTTYKVVGTSSTNLPRIRKRTVKSVSSSASLPYQAIIEKVAAAYEISPALVNAIIKVESNYQAQAVSPKGAQGLMQLMPGTAKRFGVTDVFDPEDNITGGVKYLDFLFEEFGEQNLKLVLAGYNAGEEAVRKHGNMIPPYKETQRYVKDVLALYLPGGTPYQQVQGSSIYKYVTKDGVVAFTNMRRVQ